MVVRPFRTDLCYSCDGRWCPTLPKVFQASWENLLQKHVGMRCFWGALPSLHHLFWKILITSLYLLMIISQFLLQRQCNLLSKQVADIVPAKRFGLACVIVANKNQMHLFCQIFWNIPSSFVELISTCVPGLGPAALERESANYNPWIRPTYPLPGFGMKVLLEQSHTPLFSYCLQSLTATKVELKSCHRDCKACKNWPLTDAVLHLWSCLEEGC